MEEQLTDGITIKRGFTMNEGETILYSPAFSIKKGWHWIEKWSKEPYRIVFLNPSKKQIFTYCEGDTTLESCDNQVAFVGAIKKANQFYAEY